MQLSMELAQYFPLKHFSASQQESNFRLLGSGLMKSELEVDWHKCKC